MLCIPLTEDLDKYWYLLDKCWHLLSPMIRICLCCLSLTQKIFMYACTVYPPHWGFLYSLMLYIPHTEDVYICLHCLSPTLRIFIYTNAVYPFTPRIFIYTYTVYPPHQGYIHFTLYSPTIFSSIEFLAVLKFFSIQIIAFSLKSPFCLKLFVFIPILVWYFL